MIYEFKMGYNIAETIKRNFFCTKGESAVDHSKVSRLLKKLHQSGCKNLDDQAMSGWTKSADSEVLLSVHHFHDFRKSIINYQIVHHVNKILPNF